MSPKTGWITIGASQNESSVLELLTVTLVCMYLPSTWDAADLAFAASYDGVTFSDMHEFGSPVTAQCAAGQYVPPDFAKFVGVAYLKIRSESGGVPVNQISERVLKPVFRTLE